MAISGIRLGSVASGDLITAAVPAALFRDSDDLQIRVFDLIAGRSSALPAVVLKLQ